MSIELYKISDENDVTESEIFDFTESFSVVLAKSDFSKLGSSVKKQIKIDEEEVVFKLIELSQFLRDVIVRCLESLLVDLVIECMESLGSSPSQEEFQEYTYDLKELSRFIACLKDAKYTHLKRVG